MTPMCILKQRMKKGAKEALNDALGSQPGVEVLGMAGDVESAYEGILKKEPDALMLDTKLRGGTTFDLLELFIQNDIDFPPVILMTAYMEFEYSKKALNNYRHKIMKILQKPFLGDFEAQFEECKDSLTSFYQSKKERLQDAKKAIYVKQGGINYRLLYLKNHSRGLSIGRKYYPAINMLIN